MGTCIYETGNKIKSIWLDNGWIYTADNINYSKIIAYHELNETTWFDIYGMKGIKMKISGNMVKMIKYFEEND